MATQSCLDNIKKKGGVYCPGDLCAQIQPEINEYCSHTGLGGDVPVPEVGPDGKCWCCCSCAARGTPIEVQAGMFRMIENIEQGMTVLATGGNVSEWAPREVTEIGGIAPGSPIDFCYTGFFTLADGSQRVLTSTADHLYLMPSGKLQPIQDLRPGDKVVQADGAEAKVGAVVIGQFSGGVRNFALGEFDPKKHPGNPYKGHLINTFGLVTADLAVQLAFYAQTFDDSLREKANEHIPHIGSAEFFETYDTTLYDKIVRTPEMWPEGFTAQAPPLINIPPSALSYFTKAQAEDLLDPDQDRGNSEAIARFKYLRKLFSGFYDKIYYIADWTQDVPNAWFFNDADQTYIVLSGGLLRLSTLNISGLSVIICHLVAQSQGYGCTGDADYWGVALFMREVWYDETFFDMFESGRTEIEETFERIKPDHSGENPNNICAQPSLACRLEAITNGGGFRGVPDCAKPPPAFAVTEADAPTLEQVVVTFSAKLFAASATDPENYAIKSAIVLQVKVREDEESVALTVEGMRSARTYTVTAENVLSARGQRLASGHNSARFTTP